MDKPFKGVVLIDQDGPLADFEKGFIEKFRKTFPEERFVPYLLRKSFYIRDDYPGDMIDKLEGICHAPGFFKGLPLVPGCMEAVHGLLELGYDVRICTSPLFHYENCVKEKYEWVEEHFGRNFTNRIILTKDKTVVRGKFLIDDKPEIIGITTPEWKHILFDAPYNNRLTHRERINNNWEGWREVLLRR